MYFGTDTRAAAILFGAALAAGSRSTARRQPQPRIALEVVGLGGVAVLAVAWTRLDGQSSTLYRGGFLLCGLAATAIIAAAVHPEPGPIARVLSLKPLCALGLISYGVYLYHWPIDIVLDEKRVGIGGWPLFAIQTAVTLTVAVASYRSSNSRSATAPSRVHSGVGSHPSSGSASLASSSPARLVPGRSRR